MKIRIIIPVYIVGLVLLTACGKINFGGSGNGGSKQSSQQVAGNEFLLGKVRIIHMESPRAYQHFSLYISGGNSLLEESFAGLNALAVETALESGSEELPGKRFLSEVYKNGARISTHHAGDYSRITVECVPDKGVKVWKLISQVLKRPAFSEASFTDAKQKMLDMAKKNEESIAWRAESEMKAVSLAGTHQAFPALGTTASLESMDLGMISKQYSKTLMQQCRLTIIAAGPLNEDEIKKAVQGTLDRLPWGDCNTAEVIPEKYLKVKNVILHQEQDINGYLISTLPAPGPTSKELFPALLAASRLDYRIRELLSIDENISIKGQSRYVPGNPAYIEINLNSSKPLMCAEIIISEVRKLRHSEISTNDLNSLKMHFKKIMNAKNESMHDIALNKGENLAWGNSLLDYPDNALLEKIKAKDIRKVAEKYFTGINWVFYGDTVRVDKNLLLSL